MNKVEGKQGSHSDHAPWGNETGHPIGKYPHYHMFLTPLILGNRYLAKASAVIDRGSETMAIFILQKNGDLSVHLSIQEAENSMEAPDIESGEYVRCFDDQGRVFAISGPSSRTSWGPGVVTPTEERAEQELRRLLLDCLKNRSGNDASLRELVDIVIAMRNAKPKGLLLNVAS